MIVEQHPKCDFHNDNLDVTMTTTVVVAAQGETPIVAKEMCEFTNIVLPLPRVSNP